MCLNQGSSRKRGRHRCVHATDACTCVPGISTELHTLQSGFKRALITGELRMDGSVRGQLVFLRLACVQRQQQQQHRRGRGQAGHPPGAGGGNRSV